MKKTSAASGGAVAAKSAAFPANPVSASVHKGLHRKAAQGAVPGHRKPLKQRIAENWQLYLLLLVPVIITIVYKYGPMYGIQIAFRDFKASRGITGSEWVGLEWFEEFFSSPNCGRMIKNTILLSLYSLLWSFPVPIILALALNQLRFHRFKRVVQTVLYAPHFISTMIICGMLRLFLSPSGGYDNNEVLKTMADNAGISITWDTMSDSLSEQVNIRIAGNDLPDAFNGVGFSNYDLTNYGQT